MYCRSRDPLLSRHCVVIRSGSLTAECPLSGASRIDCRRPHLRALSPSVTVIHDTPTTRISRGIAAMIPPRAVVAVISVVAPAHTVVPPRGVGPVSPVIARPVRTELHPIPPRSRACSGFCRRRPAQYSATERNRRQSKLKVRLRLRCEHLLLLRQHHFEQHAERPLRSVGSMMATPTPFKRCSTLWSGTGIA